MRRLSYLVTFSIIAVVALATTAGAQGGQQQTVSTQEATSQGINPADFKNEAGEPFPVDNKFFPLTPGTTFHYEGMKDGAPTSDDVSVTDETKEILGVATTVVHDRAFDENGKLVEDTFDWYAQDKDGNVWYFGEDTKELDPNTGEVITTEGSWEAGVGRNQPGIVMEANPKVGDHYQQEHAPGVALDKAKVLNLHKSRCVRYKPDSNPDGCFDNLLLIKEWTPLERGVIEHDYYAEGVGLILEEVAKGGKERDELVSITTSS